MKLRLAALALLAVLALPAPAAAHVSTRAPLVHEIDHLRKKTNRLRALLGREPFRTSFRYRTAESRAVRLAARALWRTRLQRARVLKPAPGSLWARLAECESLGNWRYNGTLVFDGGLQFHPGTWTRYRLPGYPRYAYAATPVQQIQVALRVLADEGWNAWPACSARLGLR